ADRNRSHWSTSKTPSYTKSVSWQHYRTSDGSLGVRAINSKSGNGGGDITYAPVYQITIQNDGQNGEIGPQAIKALMGMVDQRVQGNLLNMRRDGGMLSG
ncbi:hypothetical protein OYA92_10880, partial [Escherichia coli]|nr:hypothetical protein [Escherichia coli]